MRDPNCQLCALGTLAKRIPKTVCLLPQVTETCDIMLVAEAPSQLDDTYNRVFVGKQLKEIKAFFEDQGLKVHCSYALKCTKPRETKISARMVKACREGYLQTEIAAVQPKHIITLGANAFNGVTKRAGLTDKRGTPYKEKGWTYTVYPTLHQAQAAYNASEKILLWQDLKLFAKWIKYGVQEVAQFDPPVYIADTLKSLRKLRAKIRKSGGVAAVDIETQGLNPYHPDKHVRSIQFCWDKKFGGVFVPLHVGEGCYYSSHKNPATFWSKKDYPEAIKILRSILKETKCIWHNGKFDRVWLHVWGKRNFGTPIVAPKIHMDTLHVAFLLDENRPLGLKRLITSEFGYPTYNIPDKMTLDMDLFIPYSTRDTVATLMLAEKYTEALNAEGMAKLRKFYLKVLRRVDALYTKIEIEGWPVSLERAAKVQTTLEKLLKKCLDDLVEKLGACGVVDVDPKVFASPTKLAKLLFGTLELMPNPDRGVAYTPTGGLCTDNDALVHLRHHPFVAEILNFRAISKALSTYAIPMKEAAETRGKLTTSYKLAKAVTGRTASGKEGKGKSAKGMNLQNLPYTYELRNSIMQDPENEEDILDPWMILEVDFAQIELRIAGQLSKDEKLLWAYQNNIDLHTYRAMRTVRMTEEEFATLPPKKQKEYRGKAKPVNFGFLYGMSAHKFRRFALTDYGVEFSGQEAQAMRDDFFTDHAGLTKWYARQERQAERLGYVESLSGRRRHLPNIRLDPDSSKDARMRHQEAIRMSINCLDFETEALTQRGWIKGPELTCKDLLLTKNLDSGQLEWQQPLDLKIFSDYHGPVTEFKSRSFNAVSTSDHRWPVYNKTTKRNECKTTQQVAKSYGGYRIHRTGQYAGHPQARWTDDEVRFIGWLLTDGYYKSGHQSIGLCQCKPWTVPTIDALMARLDYSHNRYVSKVGEVFWDCPVTAQTRRIKALCPERLLSYTLLLQLTKDQLVILRDTMMLGDGTSEEGKDTFYCGRQLGADMFQVLCTLTGVASNTRYRDMSSYEPRLSDKMHNSPKCAGYWVTTLLRRDKAQVVPGQVLEHESSSGVWCPIVPNTYFVARRMGQVFITGNTPVQGFASDLKLMAMIEIDDSLDAQYARIIGEVHDSIVLKVRRSRAVAIAELCVSIMRHPHLLDELEIVLTVPLDAEAEVGNSLGEKQGIKKWKESLCA